MFAVLVVLTCYFSTLYGSPAVWEYVTKIAYYLIFINNTFIYFCGALLLHNLILWITTLVSLCAMTLPGLLQLQHLSGDVNIIMG